MKTNLEVTIQCIKYLLLCLQELMEVSCNSTDSMVLELILNNYVSKDM